MLIYQFFKNFESICPIYPKSPDIFIQRKSSQDFNAGILGRYENRDKKNYSNLTNLLDSQVEVELTPTQKHSWGFLHFTTQRDPYAG